MTYAIVAVALAGLYLFGRQLARPRHSPLGANEAANPYLILILLLALQLLDFLFLAGQSHPVIGTRRIYPDSSDIAWAAAYYALLTFSLLGGALLGSRMFRRNKRAAQRLGAASKASRSLILPTMLAIAIILFLSMYGMEFDIAEISANKGTMAREAPFVTIFLWCAVVAVGLFLTTAKPSFGLLVAVTSATAILAFFTGNRTLVFIILIFALFAASRTGKKLPPLTLYILIVPFLVLVTLYRYFFRATAVYSGSLDDFIYDRGGTFGVIFDSDELNIAETITYILTSPEGLDRYPFEGFAGLLMALVPRSAIPWKPLPLSQDFTYHIAPSRFESGGGLVTGGLSELYLEFGLLIAPLAALLLGMMLGYLAKYAARSTKIPYFWLASITIVGFLYLRTDFFNLGNFLWPLFAVFILWKALGLLLQPFIQPGASVTVQPQASVAHTMGRNPINA